MSSKIRHFYEFEEFRFDREKRVLWRGGEIVAMMPKAAEVLALLLEEHGNLVERDEILERVWNGTFVEGGNLNNVISSLRKTLGRSEMVQTVPRRGYRFTAGVREIFEDEPDLVIEKHTLSDTVIEEHEEILVEEPAGEIFITSETMAALPDARAPAAETLVLPRISGRKARRQLATAALLCVFLATGFAAFWNFSGEGGLRHLSPDQRNIGSIAILPVKPINETEDSRILSLGLTDALISRLGRLNRFVVRPFSSVDSFLESEKDALAFARELKVDAVLTGTLLNTENRRRVSVRVFDVRDGAQIWTDTFDISETDILQIQDMISTEIARNLILNLSGEEKALLTGNPTESSEAYKLYLNGLYLWNRREIWTEERNPLIFFEQAVRLDPNFALAHLGIADSYALSYDTRSAEQALQRAIELDPTLAEAHATHGFLRMFHYWDWNGAEAAFKKAVELAPNNAKSRHWYGVFLSLTGRLDEALAEMQKAHDLDPTSFVIMADIGQLYYFARDYDKAEEQLDKVLTLDQNFFNANVYKFRVLLKKGEKEKSFRQFVRLRKVPAEQIRAASKVYDPSGLDGALRYELNRANCAGFDRYESVFCAGVFNLLGETENAFAQLEYSLRERAFLLPFIRIDPIWDNLRDDVRFQEIIRQIGVQESKDN